jgi:ATP-dependent Clp protease adaptor protein ClpS
MQTTPFEEHESDQEVTTQEPAKVILFNDEIHTFEEVIAQLMKAVVFTGEMFRCMEVSHILEEIKLMTQIEV